MNHHTAPRFWERYRELPKRVQKQADRKFALLRSNPRHPSLQLKKVGRYYSARVTRDFRVLGLDHDGNIFRFWIGPHDEYERLIS